MAEKHCFETVYGTSSEEESQRVTELEDYFDTKLAAEVAAEQGTRTATVRWTVRQPRTIERAAARFGIGGGTLHHYLTLFDSRSVTPVCWARW